MCSEQNSHSSPGYKLRTACSLDGMIIRAPGPLRGWWAVQLEQSFTSPSSPRCQCNGHADYCHELDGTGCPCQNNTETGGCQNNAQADKKDCYKQQVKGRAVGSGFRLIGKGPQRKPVVLKSGEREPHSVGGYSATRNQRRFLWTPSCTHTHTHTPG